MAKQTINLGSTANDGTGESLRSGGEKINANFTELYNQVSPDFLYITDPITTYRTRIGIRTGFHLVFDRELTATGFAGSENTDWENIGGVTTT